MITGSPVWIDARVHAHQVIDGDTLVLSPIAGGRWLGPEWPAQRRRDGALIVRLAAIDAPELHHAGAAPGLRHQPLQYALAATESLRSALFAGARDSVQVYVEVLALDVYGRAVGMVWTRTDAGRPACLDSVNAALLASGAAYPDFHAQLTADWLAALDAQCKTARHAGRGVWAVDGSRQPINLHALEDLTHHQLILPRLFRRLSEFARQQSLHFDAVRLSARPLPRPQQRSRYTRGGRLGFLFREFLERRERTVFLRDCGVSLPFVECLEFDGDFCRIPGDVENFLYQSGQGERKLT